MVSTMSYTAVIAKNISIDGTTVLTQDTITSDNKVGSSPASVPIAKEGALTTRTSDTVGTLTMDASHGITTGVLIDIFWSGGSRYGVTVGTVATNEVPITSGTGDALPADETDITAMLSLANQENFVLDGDDAVCIVLKSNVPSYVRFIASDGTTVHLTVELEADDSTTTKYVYLWDGTGTNPLAGVDVSFIGFTHGSTTAQTGFLGVTLLD